MANEQLKEAWRKASKKYRDKQKAAGVHVASRTRAEGSYKQNIRNKCTIRGVGKCAMCGKREMLVGHHIIPTVDEGSSDSLDNLICLCKSCHGRIHKRMEKSIWDYEQVVENLQLLKICMEL